MKYPAKGRFLPVSGELIQNYKHRFPHLTFYY